MPDPVTGLIVGGTQLIGGAIQSRAAGKAAGQQVEVAEKGIEEQRRQLDELRNLLQPYVQAGLPAIEGLRPFAEAGAPALEQQQALAGLRGPEAQRAAISSIEQSPLLQAQMRQGEEALLQQASATGGLRGGNIQAALAQFRPGMLQQAIEDQYGRLGGLTALGQLTTQNIAQLGQASAAGTGTAGLQTGANIADLLGQQGAARAGGTLGRAAPFVSAMNLPSQFLGLQMGMGRTPGFGSLFGGAPAGAGVVTGGSQTISDRRLKTDVTRLATRSDGLGVYEFRYIWGGPAYIGLMAQEVQALYPDAVGRMGEFLTVHYDRVPGG